MTSEEMSRKLQTLFTECAGDAAKGLDGSIFPTEIQRRITESLADDFGEERAQKIAFHLVDWNSDAAFIVALHLWPERFSNEEISKYLYQFMPHVPDHLAAAAKLFGTPVTDVFEVGAVDLEED